MQREIAPLHAIPSPAEEHAAADLASLPVEMLSRSTTTLFGMQTALLCAGLQQTLQYGQAVADAWKAVGTASPPTSKGH